MFYMPFKNPEDKRKYYQEKGPEYRARNEATIKARQREWYQKNKDRLRAKVRQKARTEASTGAVVALVSLSSIGVE
jgi:hypothetical protein